MGLDSVLGSVGNITGGLLGQDSARSAGNKQKDGIAAGGAAMAYQNDQIRRDLKPWQTSGQSANNKLSMLLGLDGATAGGGGMPGGSLSNSALVDMSTGVPRPNMDLYSSNTDYRRVWNDLASQHQAKYGRDYQINSNASWIEQGLRDGLATQIEQERQQQQQSQASAKNDPSYGSLLRNFSQDDLNNDVVYNTGLQFGLDQGINGINRLAAASGGFDSGKTLKALTRFGNDYGSTKAADAYGRFNTNKQNTYNMLMGLSNTGLSATGQLTSAAQNYGQNVNQNQIGAGNAAAASQIAGTNALTSGINGAMNYYQGNQMIGALRGSSGVGSGTKYLSDYTPQYAGAGSGGWTSGYDL